MIKVWVCWNCNAYNHHTRRFCHMCDASSDQAQWQFKTAAEMKDKKLGGIYVKPTDYAKKVLDEQKEARKAKFGESWTPPEGISTFAIDNTQKVDEITTQYGLSAKIPVIVGKKKTTWIINKRNPTLRQLMTYIVSGTTKFQITRTGTAQATRYSVKAL